jgi:phage terminase large subunit
LLNPIPSQTEPLADFPKKLQFLFEPNRYKVAYGGRGSGKSWSMARALLLQASNKPLRILCAREVQKSIKQSVHTLLNDQIQALGLGPLYEVLESEIRSRSGSSFSFTGLATNTVESIKSFEGCDIVWVEEAQTVSKKSWDILIPTIRKPDSEIWVSFNPNIDTDDTYTRFVVNPPENAKVVKVNYTDNPWFPEVLETERQHSLKTNPDYANIWEGDCKAAVDGAIYSNEIREAQEGNRITTVPYDPMMKVHVVMDLGWNDSMSVILCQKGISDLRIIGYIEDDHRTLDSYSAQLKNLSYNWGTMFLPHDGQSKDFKHGISAEEIMKKLGWDIRIVPKADIESGIKLARMNFHRIYFDKSAQRLVECLKNYRRSINSATNEPGAPLHDEYSHGADAFRYLCTSIESMKNESWSKEKIQYTNRGIV